jgi:hypothetical protein
MHPLGCGMTLNLQMKVMLNWSTTSLLEGQRGKTIDNLGGLVKLAGTHFYYTFEVLYWE